MLVEEALLNEQETLFRFIFTIYLWKNEKTITFVSQIAGWQLFVWYKSLIYVTLWWTRGYTVQNTLRILY